MPGTVRILIAASLAAASLAVPATASAATINVDITGDEYTNNSNCSLREAVQSANVDGIAQFEAGCETGSGADLIDIDGPPDYSLTILNTVNDISTGDLEVTDPDGLEIEGEGSSGTDSNVFNAVNDRVFEVTAGTLTLDSLRMGFGVTSGNGGGILATSPVTLLNSTVISNTTTAGNGGGIQISGTGSVLNVNDSRVIGNIATVGTGGGIQAQGNATVVATGADAEISVNDAGFDGGGINLGGGTGDVIIDPGAAIEDNDAVFAGGGINNNSGDPASDVLLDGATIRNNDVTESVGGFASGGGINYNGAGRLSLIDSFVDFNTATGDEAQGGGINTSNSADAFTLTRSVVINNSVTVQPDADASSLEGGGGIMLAGAAAASFTDSVVAANSAIVNDPDDGARGGGIRSNGSLELNRTNVSLNDISGGTPGGAAPTRSGAGLSVELPTGVTQILNSTFSTNNAGTAGSTGGGIAVNLTFSPSLVITHTTFAENTANLGEALNVFGGGTFTLNNSVFDEGMEGCFPNPLTGVNGFNVDAGTSCVGTMDDSDLEGIDPTLGPLVDNGGPRLGGEVMESTRTHELSGPASVFDLVPPASCEDLIGADLLVDQRGATRPTDAGCEPGSYEIVRCLGEPAFIGTPGDDTIGDIFVADAFHGLGGNDTLVGSASANRLCGGAGADLLNGFTGNDMIDGGSGSDTLLGNADMDSLFARDGEGDVVDCGTEADTAQTDRLSLDSVTDCETVDALAEPPVVTPTPTTPAATPAPAKKKCKKGRKLKKGKCVKKKRKKRK